MERKPTAGLLSVGNAHAYLDMDAFAKIKNEKNFDLYLHGFLDAVMWANASGGGTLLCPPNKLILTPTNLIHIVDDYYKENRKVFWDSIKKLPASGTGIEPNKVPFGMVAIPALKDAFPCK
jgi:hypothetical protein